MGGVLSKGINRSQKNISNIITKYNEKNSLKNWNEIPENISEKNIKKKLSLDNINHISLNDKYIDSSNQNFFQKKHIII